MHTKYVKNPATILSFLTKLHEKRQCGRIIYVYKFQFDWCYKQDIIYNYLIIINVYIYLFIYFHLCAVMFSHVHSCSFMFHTIKLSITVSQWWIVTVTVISCCHWVCPYVFHSLHSLWKLLFYVITLIYLILIILKWKRIDNFKIGSV